MDVFKGDVPLQDEASAGPSKTSPLPAAPVTSTQPHVLEAESCEPRSAKQQVMEVLDLLDFHSERLRKEAVRFTEKKDDLDAGLDALVQADLVAGLEEAERDEVLKYVERIAGRAQTVRVQVTTRRSEAQENALHQVNLLIDGLVQGLRADPPGTRDRCRSFMNACSSHYVYGSADKNFESALLDCALDDQKHVRKRLGGLLTYFDEVCFLSCD